MSVSNRSAPKRTSTGSRFDTLAGVVFGVLLAVLAVSATAADVSVNAAAYANNDVTVNTINSGSMVVMIATTTPSTFNARTFVEKAYPLYAAANSAITSMDKVIMVGWCAKPTTTLNNSIACLNGSKYNDDSGNPYVFIQMRFPSWDTASTVASPASVDLSSLSVTAQLAVTSFAGLSDPDTNTSSSTYDYITNISYNSAAVYAVFGVLLGVVVIALIITCVCICRRDNAMASVNKGIIDKAINTLRSDRHKSRSGSVNTTNISEHYNMHDNAVTISPVSPRPMPPASTPPTTMPPTTTAPLSQREGSNTYPSAQDTRNAVEREMQEMKARQAVTPDASNLQKPVP